MWMHEISEFFIYSTISGECATLGTMNNCGRTIRIWFCHSRIIGLGTSHAWKFRVPDKVINAWLEKHIMRPCRNHSQPEALHEDTERELFMYSSHSPLLWHNEGTDATHNGRRKSVSEYYCRHLLENLTLLSACSSTIGSLTVNLPSAEGWENFWRLSSQA